MVGSYEMTFNGIMWVFHFLRIALRCHPNEQLNR